MTSSVIAPLTAARQAQEMVGQQAALDKIKQAIYANGDEFRIFFVRAQGGMGKTRLLEEVDKKVRGEWAKEGETAVSSLIDVIDIRLHNRSRFIRELRNRYSQPGEFRAYERAQDEVTLLRAAGAQLREMRRAEQAAIDAFLEDLNDITKNHRVVWIIDTVEQLSYITSKWLIEKGLLEAKDLENRTHQWLIDLAQNENLRNVTLILAGRGQEGASFFASMKKAISDKEQSAIGKRQLIDVELNPLTRSETRDYFAQLAQDWRTTTEQDVVSQRIVRQFEIIASDDNDRADVLWLYTGGIPVRLALYTQIIIEGLQIPKPLRYTFEKAIKQAGTDNPQNKTPALRRLQWDIEEQFINLLFRDPTDLRARVLQTLVRAPRGLSAEQLHFILDNKDNLTPDEWRNDRKRLINLTNLLHNMENYYLVKRRSSWKEFGLLLNPDDLEAATFRLGLQDEIYRIYAEHMAPHKDPKQPEITAIWKDLEEQEQSRYHKNWKYEQEERHELYLQLSAWAEFKHRQFLTEKQEYMATDERRLELQLVPDRPRTFYFEQLTPREAFRRIAINEAITTLEIEAMVYHLQRDPERNVNENYIDLGTAKNSGNQGDIDFWAQAEMWRITHDAYSLKFVNFQERAPVLQHKETMVEVLQRTMVQEDVTRWIKRRVLRGEFQSAINLAQKVETIIQGMPRTTEMEKRVYHSWNHTLITAEQRIWYRYAHIYLSQEMPETLAELQYHIAQLELLLHHTVNEIAIIREDDHKEHGFKGVPDLDIPNHPAFVRVRRLLSLACNVLGYGYTTVGQVRNGAEYYGRSLYHIRGDKGIDSHRGYVLNDLSKALSDMGRNSIAVCLDGLSLRRQLTEEVPMAVSYNTLALIYDDMDRYEEAPELVAKAIAYLRRAGAKRWLGLALTQLGESLRHLAIRAQRGEMAQATPESLYSASEMLLREARTIFTDIQEPSRLIIVKTELGSLYRDRLRTLPETASPRQKEDDYREAKINLTEAITMAREKGLQHLEVDALVNMAWTYFHTKQNDLVEETITEVAKVIDGAYFITPDHQPDINDETLVNIFWVLRQLSKLYMIQGQSKLSYFRERAKIVGMQFLEDTEQRHEAIHKDGEAQQNLQAAALAWSLAIGYAHILAPGGRMIDFQLDDLYLLLKSFNHRELDDFHQYVVDLKTTYPNLTSINVLDRFLHEFFGILSQDKQKHFLGS